VRESRNGGEFVERVRRESGIHLETISGSQECRLVWKAVRERLPLGEDRWFLVDLGGGSVEVSVVDRDGILVSESHTLGSVRLLQAFRDEVAAGRGYRELLERYVHMLKIPAAMAQWRPVGAIATGGNIEALAKLAKAPVDDRGVARLPLRDLRSVLARLEALDYEARIRDLGLREDRADVIVPAAVVYERVAELVEADAILVPGVGVREGLLLDLVDDLRDHVAHAGARDREVRAAAVSLGRRFLFDEPHAVHVAELSLSIFDQLRSLHGLGDDLRRVLLVGALLHDIGQFVSYRRHHRHSWYLITNSELPDLSPDEVRMAALVARYHRRAEPSPEHPEFAPLPEEERSAVRVLSAILRVADSLDRGHSARVASVGVRVGPERVVLEAAMSGDVGLESWALRKKGRAFENVFGRELHLEPQLP
jgi:exopolyphosphatase / guanosine-5'-triphosphate,3'-diphosphate pyrophosphatase